MEVMVGLSAMREQKAALVRFVFRQRQPSMLKEKCYQPQHILPHNTR